MHSRPLLDPAVTWLDPIFSHCAERYTFPKSAAFLTLYSELDAEIAVSLLLLAGEQVSKNSGFILRPAIGARK